MLNEIENKLNAYKKIKEKYYPNERLKEDKIKNKDSLEIEIMNYRESAFMVELNEILASGEKKFVDVFCLLNDNIDDLVKYLKEIKNNKHV